jgi:hypothetical protein
VVYHGTEKGGFTKFDEKRIGGNTKNADIGFYFSNTFQNARSYSDTTNKNIISSVPVKTNYTVFLNLKNPKIISWGKNNSKVSWNTTVDGFNGIKEFVRSAYEEGFDGAIAKNIDDTGKNDCFYDCGDTDFIAFEPNQIKLADGTNTSFDPNSDDIRFKNGGKIQFTSTKSVSINIGNDLYKFQYQRGERGDTDKPVWFAKLVSINEKPAEGRLCFEPSHHAIIEGFSLKEIENLIFECLKENELWIILEDEYGNEKEVIHVDVKYDPNIDNLFYKRGGRTTAQTPAPSKERIYGSDRNKPKSSKDSSSAESIKFDNKTLTSIENKVEEHNEAHPNKKVNLATAKAVVRRGMGAYSKSHRPTISGGKPNSRVAWGLARLNAFLYKVVNGVSKSGKYSQDNDLLGELGIAHKKFAEGGNTEDDKRTKAKQLLRNSFDYLEDDLELLGKGLNGMAFVTVIDGELYVAKYTRSLTEFWLSQMAMVSNPPHVVTIKDVKKLSDNFEYGIIHKYTDNGGVPNKAVWNVAIGIKFKEYLEAQKLVPPREKEYVRNLAIKLSSEVQDYFGGITIDTSNDNWGYEDGKLVLFDIDGNVKKAQYEEWMQKHASSKLKKGGKIPNKSKGGDCYVVAGRIALNNRLPNVKTREFVGEPYVIHAQVTGQGALAGLKYGHAWVEDDIYVYDYSNGRELKIPKEVYYKLGQVIEQQPIYFKYTFGEAKRKMAETGHFGSWDLITESGL